MERFKKTQEIVNLITICQYYQELLPSNMFCNLNDDEDTNRQVFLKIIEKLEEEIHSEVNYFLSGDNQEF